MPKAEVLHTALAKGLLRPIFLIALYALPPNLALKDFSPMMA